MPPLQKLTWSALEPRLQASTNSPENSQEERRLVRQDIAEQLPVIKRASTRASPGIGLMPINQRHWQLGSLVPCSFGFARTPEYLVV